MNRPASTKAGRCFEQWYAGGYIMGLVSKYAQEPNESRNHFRYHRRIPDSLKPNLGQGELIAVLGRTFARPRPKHAHDPIRDVQVPVIQVHRFQL